MRKRMNSFLCAVNGLRTTWREEANFQIEIALGVSVVLIGLALHFALWEWLVVTLCITAVIAAELLNTAIEDLCDKISPSYDPAIGAVKDISAAFVLVVCLGVGAVAIILGAIHLQVFGSIW